MWLFSLFCLCVVAVFVISIHNFDKKSQHTFWWLFGVALDLRAQIIELWFDALLRIHWIQNATSGLGA